MLALALAVAAGFAALGQWQLARAVANGTVVERHTETVVPLSSVASPQQPVTNAADAQRVSVSGTVVPGDFTVLSDRVNAGELGFWLVGHVTVATTEGDAGLAVAFGWAPTRQAALAAQTAVPPGTVELVGRYLASESPIESDFRGGRETAMAVPALINEWHDFEGRVYSGYLVAATPPSGLSAIDSPPPAADVSLNWLNLFYAAEWVVFAGFAVFLWYRLVRDAWEREKELAEPDPY